MQDAYRTALGLVQQAGAQQHLGKSYVPPPPALPLPATREGQQEIVAATLAAGMIAAEGKAVSVKDAVAKWERCCLH